MGKTSKAESAAGWLSLVRMRGTRGDKPIMRKIGGRGNLWFLYGAQSPEVAPSPSQLSLWLAELWVVSPGALSRDGGSALVSKPSKNRAIDFESREGGGGGGVSAKPLRQQEQGAQTRNQEYFGKPVFVCLCEYQFQFGARWPKIPGVLSRGCKPQRRLSPARC
jgi:hypothetical protein